MMYRMPYVQSAHLVIRLALPESYYGSTNQLITKLQFDELQLCRFDISIDSWQAAEITASKSVS